MDADDKMPDPQPPTDASGPEEASRPAEESPVVEGSTQPLPLPLDGTPVSEAPAVESDP